MTKSRVSLPVRKTRSSGVNSYMKIVIPVALNLILITFAIFMFYNIGKSIYIASQKLEILNTAKSEVTSLRLENIQLVMKQNDVVNHDYIETEARNRLNYAKSGEVQYVVPDSLVERYKNENVLGVNTVNLPAQNLTTRFKLWIKFLFNGV